MRIVDIRSLKTGTRVARNIYKDRVLLLSKGYIIDDAIIETIRNRELRNVKVFIDDGQISEFEKRGGVYNVDVVERHHKSVRLDAPLVVNGFIDVHSQVFVAGELKVMKEVMPYSHVSCHGPAIIYGEVYGCCLVACEKMEFSSLGSPDGMRTMISLQEYSLEKLVLLKELNEMKAAKIQPLMAKLVPPVTKVAKLGKKVNMLPDETKMKLLGAYKKYIELNEEKKKIATQLQILENKITEVATRPRILVRGPVHPGVTIRIKDSVMRVEEPLHSVEFTLEDEKVQFKKIRE
ncbi:protein of unknown function DUF342 [Desulfurispirillum indicum S5]|uniref:DUF342 domain-containing protein n=1 Tax=Desulfurispirillum indicum (strain ATCC BAA-1389 / DSM 22839 / S5) TaxID=653733 RepID=E6W0N0_DESIS|nr:FapA family protein [Desulfurispirillum indicum]ADU65282.1 protein of unknown function DUF342 [Desulfurispirillum indicum S5]